jgi:hypothetical protein
MDSPVVTGRSAPRLTRAAVEKLTMNFRARGSSIDGSAAISGMIGEATTLDRQVHTRGATIEAGLSKCLSKCLSKYTQNCTSNPPATAEKFTP